MLIKKKKSKWKRSTSPGQELMVYDSSYHRFCTIFQKKRKIRNKPIATVHSLHHYLYWSMLFQLFTCREETTPFTAENQHSADLWAPPISTENTKTLPTANLQTLSTIPPLPDGLSAVEERGRRRGIPPKHKPQGLRDWLLSDAPGSTHSPPVLERSVVSRTDFAIISGTCFCGGKNHREPLVYSCQQFSCTKKNILICLFSLAWQLISNT